VFFNKAKIVQTIHRLNRHAVKKRLSVAVSKVSGMLDKLLKMLSRIKNPVKDLCSGDLAGVVCAVVDGSLDLAARATSFFI
jgi:hypothetical protein